MENFSSIRKHLNQQQTKLRGALTGSNVAPEAFVLLARQHGQLHTARLGATASPPNPTWSYQDLILDDLSEDDFRQIPAKTEHSIAWLVWHMARIEDVAMNFLVAGEPQVFEQGNWSVHLGVNITHTGNNMTSEEIIELSEKINIQALRAYRLAVGQKTAAIIHHLTPQQLKEKVEPSHIQRVKDEGALIPAAYGIADYWSKRDIAGLLLMPATRHNLVHLNEAHRLKTKLA